ncbi:cytochrome c oxidase subunit 3 [Bowmanella dokdonensis]|uniref:Cytochrome bo(3) ubiquinol oxidase subunit 3 n=1 Tax=Bowmanella dokdonensis TaxID=751969 RepID=A0A939DQR2_9ALTE|nr:cytochrome c oxidase subunit 3 [Bowmanella dokdonensis]MBN7826191.1 cytochrome c oxidase subunit 3 [Bowmanella dokdonensis]
MTDIIRSPRPSPELPSRLAERELGFWLFLMSDLVIFALLFATYGVMADRVAGGPSAEELLELRRPLLETLLLLTSTLTMGIASLFWQSGKVRYPLILWLGMTLVCGGGFLYLELQELRHLLEQDAGPSRSGFLSAFFVLVGTHGLHVCLGMLWGLFMICQLLLRGLDAEVASRLQRLGSYWHLLDVVWIVIISAVYLPGAMP